MEEGRWEDANKEKVRIEEKQRTVRRKREADAEKAAAEGNQNLFVCKSTFYVRFLTIRSTLRTLQTIMVRTEDARR